MPKCIKNKIYYSVPEAAKELGVTRTTMLRWVTRGVPNNGITLEVLRDSVSRHYYIAEESVASLRDRFEGGG